MSSMRYSDVYEEAKGSDNSNENFIMGMTLTLKGRIQTESIKPRKTVQSYTVGSHYSTRGKETEKNIKHPSDILNTG